jgi:hypothetical protein
MISQQNLRIVRPLVITSAMLVASDVAEADYPAWSAGTTYALGARVIVPGLHRVYESAQNGNTGNAPQTAVAHWTDRGATNRWRAFDDSVSTRTQQTTSISYRIRPGQAVQSVAALNLVGASSIRIRVVDPVFGVIYDTTRSLAGHMLEVSWWEWFFGARTNPKQSIHTDLPGSPTSDILIDLQGTDELAVGVIALGQVRTFSLGTKAGARLGFLDFSRKERNEYGDTILVERPFARRATFPLLLLASEVDAFIDYLAEVRAKPCLWIGSNGRYESMTVYGICKSFDVVLSSFNYCDCDLELEGLT